MADYLKIAGRVSTIANDGVTAEAQEIKDLRKDKFQQDINQATDEHFAQIDSELDTPSSGVKDRLSTLEAQVAFSGDFQAENTPQGIISESGKIATANAVRGAIDAKVGYFECNTAANTARKDITAPGFVLTAGGCVKIKMLNANTIANASLKIGTTDKKPLYYNGERASAQNTWDANEVIEVYYDGTNYYANNVAGGTGDGVFDVSVKYPTSGEGGGNTYTLQGAITVLDNNLSANKKKGGMSIKFVQSSDNKYVQYRYMGTATTGNTNPFTNPANWQGVDDVPVAGSKNLVESGGVDKIFNNVFTSNLQNTLELGSISGLGSNTWNYVDSTTILRTKENTFLHLLEGDIIKLSDYTNARIYVGCEGDYTKGSQGWLYRDFEVPTEGNYVVIITTTSATETVTVDGLGSRLELKSKRLGYSAYKDIDGEPTNEGYNLVKSGGIYDFVGKSILFDYTLYDAPIGAILEDGSIQTSQPGFKLYTFNVSSRVGQPIIVSVSGIPRRNYGYALLRFIDNDNNITGIVSLSAEFSVPVLNYSVIVPTGTTKLQISSNNGKLSVCISRSDLQNGWHAIAPIDNLYVNDLKYGSRYFGTLVNIGVVPTPDVLNTFYIANKEGLYTFADESTFNLPKDSLAIFNFKDNETIEKTVIYNNDVKGDYCENVVDYDTKTVGKYINASTGEEESTYSVNLAASDYIEVEAGKEYYINKAPTQWGAMYDSNKDFVAYSISASRNAGIANTKITIPSNVKYIRLSIQKVDDVWVSGLFKEDEEQYKVNPKDISTCVLYNKGFDKRIYYSATFGGTVVEGKRADGTTKQFVDDPISKYVSVNLPFNVTKVLLSLLPNSIAYSTNASTISGDIIVNEILNFSSDVYTLYFNFGINDDISDFIVYYAYSYEYSYTLKCLEIPELTDIQNRVYELEQEVEELNNNFNQWRGKTILWLGTSIPWGESSEGGTSHRVDNPYPKQVCEKLGATLIDSTHGGLAQMAEYDNNAQLWVPKRYTGTLNSGGSTCLTRAECLAAYQAGLVSANLSAYSYENTILEKNADLYIFDVEPNNNDVGSEADLALFDWYNWKYTDDSLFASHRNTYIGALIYEIDQLLTEKPNAIVVFVGEHNPLQPNSHGNYVIRDMSIALCQKFHIHYINLAEKLFYVGKNKDVWVNSDNVHPKQVAYDRMAKMLINELLLIA